MTADLDAALAAEEHTTPCPGICNRAWRQAARQGHPADLEDAQPGEPIWCRTCQTTIVDALRQLPTLGANIANMPGGRLAPSGTTEGRNPTRTGSPSGSPAWDLADEIMRWVMSWEDALREHLNETRHLHRTWAALYTKPANGQRRHLAAIGPLLRDETARRRLVDAVAYLAERSTALLSWDAVATDSGREILRMATEARKLTGQDKLIHHLPLPCLRCDHKALRRQDGSDLVQCAHCHATWDSDAYDRLANAYAKSTPKQEAT